MKCNILFVLSHAFVGYKKKLKFCKNNQSQDVISSHSTRHCKGHNEIIMTFSATWMGIIRLSELQKWLGYIDKLDVAFISMPTFKSWNIFTKFSLLQYTISLITITLHYCLWWVVIRVELYLCDQQWYILQEYFNPGFVLVLLFADQETNRKTLHPILL